MSTTSSGHDQSAIQTTSEDRENLRQRLVDDFARVRELIAGSRERVHHFMHMFCAISGLGVDGCLARFQQMLEAAEARVSEAPGAAGEAREEPKVPRKIHRIWLTNSDAPVEPPADYISKLARDVAQYSTNGWAHNFWVQDPRLIPRTVEQLRSIDGNITIRTIEESGVSARTLSLLEAFTRDRKFPFAADILRMAILHKEGGVYGDLGARFASEPCASLIRSHFDFAFIFWETMFYQNSLMMMPANNSVTKAFLEITEDPYLLPKQMLPLVSGVREGMVFSGLLVTSILLKNYDSAMRICPLVSNKNFVVWSAQQSWYTDVGGKVGKFGNAFVPDSEPTFFRPDGWAGRPPDLVHPVFKRAG